MKISKLSLGILVGISILIGLAIGKVEVGKVEVIQITQKETKSERRIEKAVADFRKAQELCGETNVQELADESREQSVWTGAGGFVCRSWEEATKSGTLD